MGYVDLNDHMANSYIFGRRTLKETKKLFSHLLDILVLNTFYLHETGNPGTKYKIFCMNLICQILDRKIYTYISMHITKYI